MKKSKLSIFTAILGVIYSIYLINYFAGLSGAGSSLAVSMVMPHILAVLVATILSILLIFNDVKSLRISTFILWVLSGLLFMLYFIMILPMVTLSLIKMIKGTKK